EATAATICTIESPEHITVATVSPDGRLVAFGVEGVDGTCAVKLLDVGSCVASPLFAAPGAVYMPRLEFSPDGRKLASGVERGWDAAGGSEERFFRLPTRPLAVGFAPRGALLAVDATSVRELDPRTGLTRIRPTHDGNLVAAWIAADGAALVTLSEAGTVRAW